jgi:hypothetical protein
MHHEGWGEGLKSSKQKVMWFYEDI